MMTRRDKEDASLQPSDSLEKPAGVQTAIFGLFYVLHKERIDTDTWVVLTKLGLDFLQLFLLLLQPQFGWVLVRTTWCVGQHCNASPLQSGSGSLCPVDVALLALGPEPLPTSYTWHQGEGIFVTI